MEPDNPVEAVDEEVPTDKVNEAAWPGNDPEHVAEVEKKIEEDSE